MPSRGNITSGDAMSLAIIGGTGLRQLTDMKEAEPVRIETRYGLVTLTRGKVAGQVIHFLCRHGEQGLVPPHRINVRAQIAALSQAGVDSILATAAVGGISEECSPSTFGLLSDFISLNGPITFFDKSRVGPIHVDVTKPFCPRLRSWLRTAGREDKPALRRRWIYACMPGPRFETPAEIQVLRRMGADVVGMTVVPEAILAREAGICYAVVAVVSNWAAGITRDPLSHQEVNEMMQKRGKALKELLGRAIRLHEADDCTCRHSLDGYQRFGARPNIERDGVIE